MILFFNDTATTEIYTLSLHDALPISWPPKTCWPRSPEPSLAKDRRHIIPRMQRSTLSLILLTVACAFRSEEHTSELQSRQYLVCRLLLEKKISFSVNTIYPPYTPFYL